MLSYDPNPCTLVGCEGDVNFYAIGDVVYRSHNSNKAKDIYGYPTDKRWECSLNHFKRYIDVLCPSGDHVYGKEE